MLLRTFRLLGLLCLLAVLLPTATLADPEPNDDADWLTWTLQDAAGSTMDLSSHQNHAVYVLVFTPSSSDSCSMIASAAATIRDHPNWANRVLAICIDDSGAKALKLHIRQEEYKKRVADWETAQSAAKLAAEQAGQPFTPADKPDFVQQIEDELADPEDLAALVGYHLPFKTAARCEAMWTWLSKRMDSPQSAPRVLKIGGNGNEVNEWSALPAQFSE